MIPARLRLSVFLGVLWGLAPEAAAETIGGKVRDSSGVAVGRAEVALTTAELTVVSATRTDDQGGFSLTVPAAGRYLLIVRAPAFRETRLSVNAAAGGPVTVDIVLQVAPLSEEITVSASRQNVDSVRTAPQPVSVIPAEDIGDRVKTAVAQAVDGEAGVALQRTSPTMAGVFVRGLTGNKVNVFVDGVRYSNGAQRGGVNTFLDLIEPDTLESIEVLRGPSSAQYGSDALGGSIQFYSRPPAVGDVTGSRWRGSLSGAAGSGHRYGGGSGVVGYTAPTLGVTGSLSGRGAGAIRTGNGIDSHAAVTRFLGLSSDVLMDDRLPNTGFHQMGGAVRSNWILNPSTSFVASYMRTVQDDGDRYDQLLGGDGNLISELNDLSLDLVSVRLERLGLGPFSHASFTYSFNTQREERVNQGGNGNPTATIGHEPERTSVHGLQASLTRDLSPRASMTFGGDVYIEGLTSESYNVNPVTGAVTPRRPRVPDGASFVQGGAYAQASFEAMPDLLRFTGAVRYGGAHYEAKASDSPQTSTGPLWPDDSLSVDDVTFRVAAVVTPDQYWSVLGSISSGFRAPHMTDLGTLGLTGSGFEVAAPDVAGLNGQIGTTADASAVSTGRDVEQVGPETSLQYEASIRYRRAGWRTELSFFVNNVHDNIQKQALILPQGAVGTVIGGQAVTSQTAAGAVFVAAATPPVLVRANFDNARIWGIEHVAEASITSALSFRSAFTYLRAVDTETDLPPNIEGGTPAPQLWLSARYTRPDRRWWVEPYAQFGWEQPHLSTLDLGDRRTGAGRSRASIQSFFRNGARARGWVTAGADNIPNNADDILIATGETLLQVQDRVLGFGVNSSSLFTAVQGFATFGVRSGASFGNYELIVDFENLNDENYRGISWGVDAPGRGVTAKFVARF